MRLNSQSAFEIKCLKSFYCKFKPISARLKLGNRCRCGNYIHRKGGTLNEIEAIAEIFQLVSKKLQPVERNDFGTVLTSTMNLCDYSKRNWSTENISDFERDNDEKKQKELCVCVTERESRQWKNK